MPQPAFVSRTLLALSLVLPMAAAQAQDYCRDILTWGVFEEKEAMDLRYAQKSLRSQHCGSSSGSGEAVSVDWGRIGFANRDDFCKTSESASLVIMERHDRGRWASRTLAEAWTSCMVRHQGFVERFQVSRDQPQIVRYQVTFNPGPLRDVTARVTKFTTVNLKGPDCKLPKGRIIDRAPTPVVCERIDPCKSASITLDTTQGSPHDMAGSEVPPPPQVLMVHSLGEMQPLPDGVPSDAVKTCTMHCRGERVTDSNPRSDCPEGPIVWRDAARDRVFWGSWENAQCGVSGTGWYATKIGSCGTNGGPRNKRCDHVEVNYMAPSKSCRADGTSADIRPLTLR